MAASQRSRPISGSCGCCERRTAAGGSAAAVADAGERPPSAAGRSAAEPAEPALGADPDRGHRRARQRRADGPAGPPGRAATAGRLEAVGEARRGRQHRHRARELGPRQRSPGPARLTRISFKEAASHMHEPHERDLIAAYSLDVETPIGHGRALVPRHVMAMPHKERAKWLKENGLVLPVGGGSWAYFEMMHPYQNVDFTAVTAASQTALTPDAILTLPPNFFDFAGKKIWFRAMGKQSN